MRSHFSTRSAVLATCLALAASTQACGGEPDEEAGASEGAASSSQRVQGVQGARATRLGLPSATRAFAIDGENIFYLDEDRLAFLPKGAAAATTLVRAPAQSFNLNGVQVDDKFVLFSRFNGTRGGRTFFVLNRADSSTREVLSMTEEGFEPTYFNLEMSATHVRWTEVKSHTSDRPVLDGIQEARRLPDGSLSAPTRLDLGPGCRIGNVSSGSEEFVLAKTGCSTEANGIELVRRGPSGSLERRLLFKIDASDAPDAPTIVAITHDADAVYYVTASLAGDSTIERVAKAAPSAQELLRMHREDGSLDNTIVTVGDKLYAVKVKDDTSSVVVSLAKAPAGGRVEQVALIRDVRDGTELTVHGRSLYAALTVDDDASEDEYFRIDLATGPVVQPASYNPFDLIDR